MKTDSQDKPPFVTIPATSNTVDKTMPITYCARWNLARKWKWPSVSACTMKIRICWTTRCRELDKILSSSTSKELTPIKLWLLSCRMALKRWISPYSPLFKLWKQSQVLCSVRDRGKWKTLSGKFKRQRRKGSSIIGMGRTVCSISTVSCSTSKTRKRSSENPCDWSTSRNSTTKSRTCSRNSNSYKRKRT